MSTKTIAAALLTAGMVLGSLTAAKAGCSHYGQTKEQKQSEPTSS